MSFYIESLHSTIDHVLISKHCVWWASDAMFRNHTSGAMCTRVKIRSQTQHFKIFRQAQFSVTMCQTYIMSGIVPLELDNQARKVRGIDLKKYIVTCQRGGVSNKPPWLQAATRHEYLDKVNLMTNYQNWKHGPTVGPVLLRQGEPGTSQYIFPKLSISAQKLWRM